MTRDQVFDRLEEVFRDVFDDDGIVLYEDTTADDIDDWDSIEHITLIAAVEKEFGMTQGQDPSVYRHVRRRQPGAV